MNENKQVYICNETKTETFPVKASVTPKIVLNLEDHDQQRLVTLFCNYGNMEAEKVISNNKVTASQRLSDNTSKVRMDIKNKKMSARKLKSSQWMILIE